MRRQSVITGVGGLVVGLVIGFIFANSVNRSGPEKQRGAALPAGSADGRNPALPPDHPTLGTSNGESKAPTGEGALPQVLAAIEKAKAASNDFEAQMTAADLYYQIRRFEEAAQFYDAALKVRPNDTEAMIKAGNAYFDAEKYEQAEKRYLAALAKEPRNLNLRTDLGLTFFLRTPRQIDRAIKEYKTARAIDPNFEITLQNLALAYTEKGDTASLNETLAELKRVNPQNPLVTGNATPASP